MTIALMFTNSWRPSRTQVVYMGREIVKHFRITEYELVGPVEFKFTQCPSIGYDPRYQLAPGAVPQGAGFAAAGVGRDVDGRPWA